MVQIEVQAQQLTALEEHGKLARQKQEQEELRERVGYKVSHTWHVVKPSPNVDARTSTSTCKFGRRTLPLLSAKEGAAARN